MVSHISVSKLDDFKAWIACRACIHIQASHSLKQLQFPTEGIIQFCLIVCYVTRCLKCIVKFPVCQQNYISNVLLPGSSYSEKTFSLRKNDSDHNIFSQMKRKEIILLGLKGHSFAFQLKCFETTDKCLNTCAAFESTNTCYLN